MAEEWPKEKADKITEAYHQLKGKYKEYANREVFGGAQLPHEQAKSILDNLIGQQKNEQGGLEATINQAQSKVSPIVPIIEKFGTMLSYPYTIPIGATFLMLFYLI